MTILQYKHASVLECEYDLIHTEYVQREDEGYVELKRRCETA